MDYGEGDLSELFSSLNRLGSDLGSDLFCGTIKEPWSLWSLLNTMHCILLWKRQPYIAHEYIARELKPDK